MADTARRHRPRSCTRLSQGNASAGIPMRLKRRNTSSQGNGECTWKTVLCTGLVPGSVFVLPTPVKHDLVNVGNETLCAVAFSRPRCSQQNFDNVMLPPNTHILGSLIGKNSVQRYGFGGAAGFAASPGFGGAPPAVAGPPGRSSSGTARISCSTNDSG